MLVIEASKLKQGFDAVFVIYPNLRAAYHWCACKCGHPKGVRKQTTGTQLASKADCEGKRIKKQRKEEHALQNTLLNTVSPTASENLAMSHSDF